jgi:hypothetical protein
MSNKRAELIATLAHTVHRQHGAIDALIARLCFVDKEFMPSQWTEVWSVVVDSHKALQDALSYERTKGNDDEDED